MMVEVKYFSPTICTLRCHPVLLLPGHDYDIGLLLEQDDDEADDDDDDEEGRRRRSLSSVPSQGFYDVAWS